MASPTLSQRRSPHRVSSRRLAPPPAAKFATAACPRARGRRIASNFAFLSLAELVCRASSVFVMLALTNRLGVGGYGRIEFAFSIVFWLVLLVRDSSDVMVARELSRHPRLIKPLVDHVLAFKMVLAVVLFSGLTLAGRLMLRDHTDWLILSLYGLMLFTTAIGLDFVYRGTESLGLLAVSLCLRTLIYGAGVLAFVGDGRRIAWVPIWLTVGEACGIGLVWLHYLYKYRMPRLRFEFRFIYIIMQRGRTVCLIQLSQAFICTADLLIVGMTSGRWDVGRYGAPYRIATAILTFGLIFQQAAFPTLARLWRHHSEAGREALDSLVEVLMTALVPVAIGGTILAEPLVELLFSKEYAGTGYLLAMNLWRAPLLSLAFLYQTTLIALNRETVGVRSLAFGAVGIAPLVLLLRWQFGLGGAAAAVLLMGLALVLTGYRSLVREGRQPVWHHHLGKPLAASLAMVPVCLALQHWHVLLAVLGGALAYTAALTAMGGFHPARLWRAAFRPVAEAGEAA